MYVLRTLQRTASESWMISTNKEH